MSKPISAADWGRFATWLTIAGVLGGFLWKFLLLPALIHWHRWLGRKAFAAELARNQRVEERLDEIERRIEEIDARVSAKLENLDQIPAVRALAERAVEIATEAKTVGEENRTSLGRIENTLTSMWQVIAGGVKPPESVGNLSPR